MLRERQKDKDQWASWNYSSIHFNLCVCVCVVLCYVVIDHCWIASWQMLVTFLCMDLKYTLTGSAVSLCTYASWRKTKCFYSRSNLFFSRIKKLTPPSLFLFLYPCFPFFLRFLYLLSCFFTHILCPSAPSSPLALLPSFVYLMSFPHVSSILLLPLISFMSFLTCLLPTFSVCLFRMFYFLPLSFLSLSLFFHFLCIS